MLLSMKSAYATVFNQIETYIVLATARDIRGENMVEDKSEACTCENCDCSDHDSCDCDECECC